MTLARTETSPGYDKPEGPRYAPGPDTDPDFKAQTNILLGTPVESPEAAVKALREWRWLDDREQAVMLCLDTKHRILKTEVVSIGSVDHTFMTPREFFRIALINNAAAIIVAHSHPSGEPSPSEDDKRVTRRLVEVGSLLGVEILDHVVVGWPRTDLWVSMARKGLV